MRTAHFFASLDAEDDVSQQAGLAIAPFVLTVGDGYQLIIPVLVDGLLTYLTLFVPPAALEFAPDETGQFALLHSGAVHGWCVGGKLS